MQITYYKSLDGIRAVAVFLVMFYHYFQGINNTLILKIVSIGQTGVDLFFVLSGFLITRILLNTKTDIHFFKNFFIKRVLRIFPAYYFFLFIGYFVLPIILSIPFYSFSLQIYHYLYLQNFAFTFNWSYIGPKHFWSLSVEEHFYLFWPFVIYYLNIFYIQIAIIIMIFVALILRLIMFNNGYEVFYFTFTRIDSLAIGAILSIIEFNKHSQKITLVHFLCIGIISLLIAGLLFISFSGSGLPFIQLSKYTLISLFYFGIIGATIKLKNSSILSKLLQNKFFMYSGKISYGLYIFHILAFRFANYLTYNSNQKSTHSILNFCLSIIIAFLFSTICYYLIEQRFLKLKTKFI